MQAKILMFIGSVEIIENGKSFKPNKGMILSENATIITKGNSKVELEINGKIFSIHDERKVIIKNLLNSSSSDTVDPTDTAGVRG